MGNQFPRTRWAGASRLSLGGHGRRRNIKSAFSSDGPEPRSSILDLRSSTAAKITPMNRRVVPRFILLVILLVVLRAGVGAQGRAKSPLVERVGDTGFIQLQAPSFSTLDDKQKQLAYWLTQASIAIDPIVYDQLSRFGLRQKRLLEGIMAHHAGVAPAAFGKIREYALRFWANRGNHNETTAQKFLPVFTFDDWQDAALKAQVSGAFASA